MTVFYIKHNDLRKRFNNFNNNQTRIGNLSIMHIVIQTGPRKACLGSCRWVVTSF